MGERGFSKSWGLHASVSFSPFPSPCHALFWARPNFCASKKLKMPQTCGKPYGNACFAGYGIPLWINKSNPVSAIEHAMASSNEGWISFPDSLQILFLLFHKIGMYKRTSTFHFLLFLYPLGSTHCFFFFYTIWFYFFFIKYSVMNLINSSFNSLKSFLYLFRSFFLHEIIFYELFIEFWII